MAWVHSNWFHQAIDKSEHCIGDYRALVATIRRIAKKALSTFFLGRQLHACRIH